MLLDLMPIATNPMVIRTLVHSLETENDTLQRLSRKLSDGATAYTVTTKPQAELIGAVFIHAGDLSYFVAPLEWGKGYATEMVGAAIRGTKFPQKVLPLKATLFRSNIASRRLLERLGFVFYGLERRSGTAILNYRL
jgi:RimJ/RimL family protein N-acetyltransferase